MGVRGIAGALGGAFALALAASTSSIAEPSANVDRDGTVTIAGHKLRCENVRSKLDARLPNLGIAVPARSLLVMNPALLAKETKTVRLFVFHHECGHHHVGASETKADCWAVERGVREGWLSKPGLGEICKSFGDTPETATHPSSFKRCVSLQRCFASVQKAIDSPPSTQEAKAQPVSSRASARPPALSAGPTLVRAGTLP